jgi:putative inorganic carbon (hco3(-)) transporter
LQTYLTTRPIRLKDLHDLQTFTMLFENALSIKDSIKNWLREQLFSRKLNTPFGFLLLTTFGLLVGSAIPLLGIKASGMAIAGVVGLPVIIACMFYHQFGIMLTLTIGFLISFITKYVEAPVGTAVDGLLLLMVFGILIGQIVKKDWAFAKDPISTWLLIWIYYNIFEALNPVQESKLAYLYTVRSLAILNLLYFIACYSFTSLARIKQVLHFILFLATICAFYGLKQEFLGMSGAEKAWLNADPERFQLFFQWGRMRIFSLLSDAMTFGIMMTYVGLFCWIYATAPMSNFWRMALVINGLVMLVASVFSGTRTCFLLLPMGMLFYALMTLRKELFIAFGVFAAIGTVVVWKGANYSPALYRVRSAFEPSEDASVQIRYYNQQRIRPYIYSHPIGFGPGSTGLWARRFTPDSFLAKFAHDSYYVRLAVEEGWIGMALYMAFLFVVLRRALYYYLRVRQPDIKTLYLCLMTALFVLSIANYPQEAIVQMPTSLVVYVFFAAIVRLKDFDPHYQSVVNGQKG